ncbi:MAG TPA: LLM class F420-dependent oxidoreductase [Chloroflexia bacterium]|nr:LLM class F420-dependent oxidoreductase [Chloroflexia bacterium]
MKIGLQVNNFTWDGGEKQLGETFGAIGRRAEEAGFDSFWVMDHFFQIGGIGPAEWPMLEGYSALAFIAGQTSKMKLGTMVTGVTYRHPGILVKTVTTLDVLSRGRAYMGIGAAWFEREHLGLGVPYPPLKERFERLEETLQIAHQMWSGEVGAYNGTHYQLAETLNVPQVISKPHPPILIGGTGEQKTLRFVAKYGDACNLFVRMGEDVLKHKLEVLRGHCETEGRPYEEIEKTSLDTLLVTRDGQGDMAMSPQQAIDYFGNLAQLGFDHALISMRNVSHPDAFDVFRDEVVPAVHEITSAGR